VNFAAGTAVGLGHDRVTGVENASLNTTGPMVVIGTKEANRILADGRPATVRGNDGDDHLSSNGFDDQLFGGGGDDTIEAAFGDDTLDGGAGTDTLNGGPGMDTCTRGEVLLFCP